MSSVNLVLIDKPGAGVECTTNVPLPWILLSEPSLTRSEIAILTVALLMSYNLQSSSSVGICIPSGHSPLLIFSLKIVYIWTYSFCWLSLSIVLSTLMCVSLLGLYNVFEP